MIFKLYVMLVNTYKKISHSDQNVIVSASLLSPYIKYSFSKNQIDKINYLAKGRTRLLILLKEDAEFLSQGHFEETFPFRNYRLFTVIDNKLIEYPIPKTYLDTVVDSIGFISKKFGF